jgi:hypothetical protein
MKLDSRHREHPTWPFLKNEPMWLREMQYYGNIFVTEGMMTFHLMHALMLGSKCKIWTFILSLKLMFDPTYVDGSKAFFHRFRFCLNQKVAKISTESPAEFLLI